MRGRQKKKHHTQSQGQQLLHDKKKKLHLNQYSQFVIGIVGVVLVLAVSWFILREEKESPTVQPAIDEVYSNAQTLLAQDNISELSGVAEDILALPEYEKDVNALYILVSYYIKLGNADRARQYMNKLMLLYDAKTGFSQKLAPTKTVIQLDEDIRFLEKQKAEFRGTSLDRIAPE